MNSAYNSRDIPGVYKGPRDKGKGVIEVFNRYFTAFVVSAGLPVAACNKLWDRSCSEHVRVERG